MRKRSHELWRDFAVRQLARLSLVAVLSVLGTLFVGGAATSQASESAVTAAGSSATSQTAMPDQPRPAGLLLVGVVVTGGLAVLMVGAFSPPSSSQRRELAQLTNR
jgi:hypothetical protein